MPFGMEVGLGLGVFVLDGDPAPFRKRWARAPNFRPMSIVAKRSPISATAEHLFWVWLSVTVPSIAWGAAVPLFGGDGSRSNTMSPELRPSSVLWKELRNDLTWFVSSTWTLTQATYYYPDNSSCQQGRIQYFGRKVRQGVWTLVGSTVKAPRRSPP